MSQDGAENPPTSKTEGSVTTVAPQSQDFLDVSTSEAEMVDSPSLASIDELLTTTSENVPVEENEPVPLTRSAMTRSGHPPPLPRKLPPPTPPPPKPSSPPPKPSSPVPKLSAPPPLPFKPVASRSNPPPRMRSNLPPPLPPSATRGPALELLQARIATLQKTDDKVTLGRCLSELAIALDVAEDDSESIAAAKAALTVDPALPAMHALLRRKLHADATPAELLVHLDQEIAQASSDALRVPLLTERARLLEAAGRNDEALAAWSHVLAQDPRSPAGLRGKESALALADDATPGIWEARATHLGELADAYAGDPRVAAWMEVERGWILEHKLGKVDAARAALRRALTLEPKVGPVRRALVRHVAAHRDAPVLVTLLDEEGQLETNPARAARLELEAATVAEGRLGDVARAITLLERAAKRAPTSPSVDPRVLADLVRLHEAAGRPGEAARARRARLRFLARPADRAEELRALARVAEKAGDLDGAIADLDKALAEDAEVGAVSQMDRLLAEAGRHEQRVGIWLTDAARTPDLAKRTESLLKAATIAEKSLGRTDDAIRHLKTAWTTHPGHPEVLEALTRLLSRNPVKDEEARPRLELYVQAADVAKDAARKIAYLEKIALIAEETLGDHARATAAYEEILSFEPDRIGAILGLARTAARKGDDKALYRALLDQARITPDPKEALVLRTRAATAIARTDATRALSLITEVLTADPTLASARALMTRLHEDARRWELVTRSLEETLVHSPKAERLPYYLYLAEIQEARLRDPSAALETLRRARADFPSDARIMPSIARVLAAHKDPIPLREAHESLARDALTEAERAAHLVLAAEIEEHKLGNLDRATEFYEAALASTPDDEMIAERLERLQAGRPGRGPKRPFDRALHLVDTEQDLGEATRLLESITEDEPDHVPALRLLERIHRKMRHWDYLAVVLSQEADAFAAPLPKLGALWAMAELDEWKAVAKTGVRNYTRILTVDPEDRGALAATVRLSLRHAVRGERDARHHVTDALRRLSVFETGGERIATEMLLGTLLEGPEGDPNEAAAAEALEHYRRVMAIDPLSVTATWGVRRLAHRLGHVAAHVQANTALAELATDPKMRSRYLLEAADLLLHATDTNKLGTPNQRADRAAHLLDQAVLGDPDSAAAARTLIRVRNSRQQFDELLSTLRAALKAAKDREAVIAIGTEIARICRDEAPDLSVATAAMQRVHEVAPEHAPSLLTLAELYIAQRAWPEAVQSLESVVHVAADTELQLTALFALASIYDKVLAQKVEHERVLRAAIALQPGNTRALGALVEMLQQARAARVAGEPGDDRELTSLMRRLAGAETDPNRQSEMLLRIADLEIEIGDIAAAEHSMIDAIARTPDNARAFARLAALFRKDDGLDAAAYARALQALIARGRDVGHADARWFAALGQLEADSLGRLHDGIAHREWAVQLDPTLYETRFELADSYAKTGSYADAIRTLTALILPDPRPLTQLADAGMALGLLEKSLDHDKRSEDAVVVSELRSIFGDLESGREAWLRARALLPFEQHHEPLDRASIVTSLLPSPGRHVLLEVAAAGAGLEAKVLRANLADVGVSSRDRITARSGHPLRVPFDRAMVAFGLEEVELVVSAAVDKVRVIAQDAPWVVVPLSLGELPQEVQVAAFARAAGRILVGVPWLGELSETSILAWLIAVARQVDPTYGDDDRDNWPPDTWKYEPLVAKAIGRKQKKLLDELTPHLQAKEGRKPDMAVFVRALTQCEVRAAYVVSGDLSATARMVALDEPTLKKALARPGPAALGSLLTHPILGDTVRFALAPESTIFRKRLGSAWAT